MNTGYVESSTGILKRVLLCPPKYLQLKPINKIASDWIDAGVVIDLKKAMDEHDELIRMYRNNSIEVELMEPVKYLTSQVFSRDVGFNLSEGYVLGRFKEKIREEETKRCAAKLDKMGIPVIAVCSEGILEGGDFWQMDEKTLAIGILQRTDETGIDNIEKQLKLYGYRIIRVRSNPEYLHLDMIFNIVGHKTAVTYYDGLPDGFKGYLKSEGFDLIKVREEDVFKHYCNLQALGNRKVISLKNNVDVNRQLRELGFVVYELDCSEILKAGGGAALYDFSARKRVKVQQEVGRSGDGDGAEVFRN